MIFYLSTFLMLLTFLGSPQLITGQDLPESPVLNVRDFGARGDGVSDDYQALLSAAQTLCQTPGATLLFPPGTYRIGQVRVIEGPGKNAVQNIRFRSCDHVNILGYGAQIVLNGSLHRQADRIQGGFAQSYSESVIPFQMIDSAYWTIAGFELNGRADQITRDANVVEAATAGILTTNCHDYVLQDLDIHHFATDGITLGGNSVKADRGATLQNVRSHNNGRQGLSIIQLRGALIRDSQFFDTGKTGGDYGAHPPAAGVDIEPVRGFPEEDVATGDLVFENCRFEGNLGSQFVSAWPSRVESITVRQCYVQATEPGSEPIGFMNAAMHALTEDSTFVFAGKHGIVFVPPANLSEASSVGLSEFNRNTIQVTDPEALYGPLQPAPVRFIGNNVVYQQSGPRPLKVFNLLEVSDNTFTVSSGSNGDPNSSIWISSAMNTSNNRILGQ